MYMSAHSNHETGEKEDAFIPLPTISKENIAIKISIGLLIERIMEGSKCSSETRHVLLIFSFSENVTRKHLVTGRDILNIKTRVQDQAIIKHRDDATSVMLAVAELQQEKFNPVFYFKQQHVVDELYPQFSREAFLLMLLSEFQQRMYLRFASKILCIDSTHDTNAYKFKLLTAKVADDFAVGKKVCLCLVLLCICIHVPSKMSAHMENCYV